MSATRHHFQISKDGTVNTPGVDYGGKITVLARNRKCLVVKIAAHTYWTGHALQPGYASPETKVFNIVSEFGADLTVEELISWETKRKAKV